MFDPSKSGKFSAAVEQIENSTVLTVALAVLAALALIGMLVFMTKG